jgi:hypothetical protein
MKIIIVSLVVLLLSCDKIKEDKTCNCYKEYYKYEAVQGSQGNFIMQWNYDYKTTSQPDLCEKETGQFVEEELGTKYKVVCN